MANLELLVTITDLNVSKAAVAFLRKCPMPQIPDPDWQEGDDPEPQPRIDEFATTKEWVEDWLKRDLLRAVNHGIEQLASDSGEKLTKDIFL